MSSEERIKAMAKLLCFDEVQEAGVREALRAERLAALEEAARECEKWITKSPTAEAAVATAICVESIRALKGEK